MVVQFRCVLGPRAAGAAFEQLLSKKASKIIVKHCEMKLDHKKHKKHSKIDFSDLQFSCSLCFDSQYFRELALYEVFLQSELSRDVL